VRYRGKEVEGKGGVWRAIVKKKEGSGREIYDGGKRLRELIKRE